MLGPYKISQAGSLKRNLGQAYTNVKDTWQIKIVGRMISHSQKQFMHYGFCVTEKYAAEPEGGCK